MENLNELAVWEKMYNELYQSQPPIHLSTATVEKVEPNTKISNKTIALVAAFILVAAGGYFLLDSIKKKRKDKGLDKTRNDSSGLM